VFSQIIPFRYLSPEQRASLRDEVREHSFEPGDVVIRQGDSEDKRVFLLQSGSVAAIDTARTPAHFVRTIEAEGALGRVVTGGEPIRAARLQEDPRTLALVWSPRIARDVMQRK
jgi:hypothetical protein